MVKRKIRTNKLSVKTEEQQKMDRIAQLEGYQEKYISCSCMLPSHQLRFYYFVSHHKDIEQLEELNIAVYLNTNKSFFARLWHGIKYIFGFGKPSPAFDDVLIWPEKAKELREFIDEYLLVVEHGKKAKQ